MTTDRSSLQTRARHRIPGGVNSPVRAFNSVGGDPFFAQSASGAHLTDTDGNNYIDFCIVFELIKKNIRS